MQNRPFLAPSQATFYSKLYNQEIKKSREIYEQSDIKYFRLILTLKWCQGNIWKAWKPWPLNKRLL